MPVPGKLGLLLALAVGAVALGVVLLILSSKATAQQELREIDKMLLGLPFNKDKMVEQAGESPPVNGSGQPAGRSLSGDDDDHAPAVIDVSAIAPADPDGAPTQFEPIAGPLALVLPLDAEGLVGDAARAFYDGFNHAAQVDGKIFPLELFSTDGRPESDVAAYREAVRIGSGRIVGPLLRSAVEQIARLPPNEKVPSLLLQMPDGGAAIPQFAYPLGAESEIIQFVRVAAASPAQVWLLVEPSELGRRINETFDSHWRAVSRRPARSTIITDSNWVQIHGKMRELLQNELEPAIPPLVFAAGSSAFALRARSHVPSAMPVYALSAVYSGVNVRTAGIVRDGLRFFETPWLATPQSGMVASYDNSEIRERPAELQRYYAAGIDAFILVGDFEMWGKSGIWRSQGVTGKLELVNGSFLRSGILVELRKGRLNAISGIL